MIKNNATVLSNEKIAKDVYRMVLRNELEMKASCGQFVEVEIHGFYLRRPISICEIIDEKTIIIVYKVVGEGTKVMSECGEGDILNVFGPCGNGFPVTSNDVILIGGGVGVPPLVETAKQYLAAGRKASAVLGFNSSEDVILKERFEELGVPVFIATMDGSAGTKGTVMDAIAANQISVPYLCSCGPLPMLKAVSDVYDNGYISLEARMACGIGACMGCVVKDKYGSSLRVCHDGPVFEIGKVEL
ncbi:MAG: dihydroorotate dehydrogenase electron transfer subunit [Bulleidia sp.]